MFFFNIRQKKKNLQEKNENITVEALGLTRLLEYIKEICGVDLGPKEDVLRQRFVIFCQNHNIESFDKLYNLMKIDKKLEQDVINLITVNETYFYREQAQLEATIEYAKSLGSSARILCAPCASGEEVYSLAMIAIQKSLLINNLKIIGIDINSEAIKECFEARYKERSLHRLSDENKNLFFRKDGKNFIVKKELLPSIDFKIINIFDDNFLKLEPFDIILSRNMMIYFNNEFKIKAVKQFHKLLKYKGRLYTGHADLIPNTPLFNKELVDGVNFYEKID